MATETIHHKTLALKHVVSADDSKGVAVLQQQRPPMATTATAANLPSTGRFSFKGRVNGRQIFGIAMLIVVDLIWVGSAGLTRVSK